MSKITPARRQAMAVHLRKDPHTLRMTSLRELIMLRSIKVLELALIDKQIDLRKGHDTSWAGQISAFEDMGGPD